MPGIDLSTLTAPELRQLLRLARGRHDGLLIDRVEWEIAQRKSLESRVGVDLKRSAPSLIEDGDVTIDEVRAFRRPGPGLPPPQRRRTGSGRVSAMLGGLVAGSALTAGAFASAGSGWRLPATIEIPSLPRVAFAERPPAPKPVLPPKPVVVATASSDAVAGFLAPEPFPAQPPPPPPSVEVVEAPPPPPIEVAEVIAPPVVEKPTVEKAKADKPKLAEKKKPAAKAKKTELAKKQPDAKAKTAVAAKKPADKAKLAARKDPKAKTAVAAKKDPKAKTAVAAKDTKAKTASAKAKDASKTKLAAKDKPKAKVAAKPASKATAKAEAKKPAPKTTLAKAPAKPKAAAKAPTKPKAQVAEAAAQGEAHDAIGTLLARAEGAAQ